MYMEQTESLDGFDSSVLAAIIACAVSFIAAIILMMTVGKDSIPESK